MSLTTTCVCRFGSPARDIRKNKVGLIPDATQNARMGQSENADSAAEFHYSLQQETYVAAGHGVLRYTGLIAVSVRTDDALEESLSAIEQEAVQTSRETRRLVGQRTLPLCRAV
ncbi:hypothetical protein [Demequina globuliformis]|uniref:hypothetical protein n=1 Tax=Demequina globuliformis TaxID=676202 RepID=UPI0013791D20|nr:hypothetical protein [Demequina globuliformis]